MRDPFSRMEKWFSSLPDRRTTFGGSHVFAQDAGCKFSTFGSWQEVLSSNNMKPKAPPSQELWKQTRRMTLRTLRASYCSHKKCRELEIAAEKSRSLPLIRFLDYNHSLTAQNRKSPFPRAHDHGRSFLTDSTDKHYGDISRRCQCCFLLFSEPCSASFPRARGCKNPLPLYPITYICEHVLDLCDLL